MTVLDSVKAKIDSVEITRIVGPITVEAIENLKQEVAEASSKVKTSLFTRRDEFGHLPLIATQTEYRTLIGDNTWNDVIPVILGPYDTTIMAATNSVQTLQRTAIRNIKKSDHEVLLYVLKLLRKKIKGAVDKQYLAAL